jgi:uncharacterized protein YecE (DUF72 family)
MDTLDHGVFAVTEYLVGTGGWAYFNVPGKSALRAYSEIFNFVEVNYTFYEYPDLRVVEGWRRTVPQTFTFAVRCHQDLTHRVGLRPVDEAYAVLAKMKAYCGILRAPFLVLETPASYELNIQRLSDAKALFSSVNLSGVRLLWEARAPVTQEAAKMMQDLNIVQATDLSREQPKVQSDVMYSRLFGKGQQNLYQFTDEELFNIDRKVLDGLASGVKKVSLSYHGARMYSDAARFLGYMKTGKFMAATSAVGVESVKAVLSEDAHFPLSKSELLAKQGWKVVDVKLEKRVHLSELFKLIPDRTYADLTEVSKALEGII